MTFNNIPPFYSQTLAELLIGQNPDKAVVDCHRVRGGGFSVENLANRDLIPADLRKEGVSQVFVKSTKKFYVLIDGIANTNWVELFAISSNNTININGNSSTSTTSQNSTGGVGNKPSKANKGMATLAVINSIGKVCATPIAEKPLGYVTVIIGGTAHTVGDADKTKDCYFSGNNGTNARAFDAIQIGDFCYWNPASGLDIVADDIIEFHYDIIDTTTIQPTTGPITSFVANLAGFSIDPNIVIVEQINVAGLLVTKNYNIQITNDLLLMPNIDISHTVIANNTLRLKFYNDDGTPFTFPNINISIIQLN